MSLPSKAIEAVIREMGQNYSDALDWILLQDEECIDNISELMESYQKTRNQFHKAILVILVERMNDEFVFDRVTVKSYDQLETMSQKLGI